MGRRSRGPPRCAGDRAGGRARRHVHADLHVRYQWRPQGRDLQPRQGRDRRCDDDRPIRARARRHLLCVHAAVPLERGAGRLGGVTGVPGLDGVAAQVLCLAVSSGRPTLRRDLRELCRQAAVVCARYSGSPRRRGQPAEGGVRERGCARRCRPVRAQIQHHRRRRIRLHRRRSGDRADPGHPAGGVGPAAGRHRHHRRRHR